MRFTKAHATGNDFIVLPDWDDELQLEPTLVRLLCDRRRGLGADGVLRLTGGGPAVDAFMDYRNADGSMAAMCGNGLRVAAKYLVDRALGKTHVRIGTGAGTRKVTVRLGSRGRVEEATVEMGAPNFHPAAVPFDAPGDDAIDVPVAVDGSLVRLTAVSFGNPHAVVVVDQLASTPVESIGAKLENHPRFPNRTNVEFAEVTGPDEVRARVWERGVGETAGCGSGACAVLVALRRIGAIGDEATLHFPGGDVHVRYDPGVGWESGLGAGADLGEGAGLGVPKTATGLPKTATRLSKTAGGTSHEPTVLLTGSATEIASGELDPIWLGAASSDL